MKWTQEEILKLKNFYPALSLKELSEIFPNRSQKSLVLKAFKLGIKQLDRWTSNRRGTVLPLLFDTPLSFYWMGFLLADGHFSKRGYLICRLALKDSEHLTKLASYLNTTNHIKKLYAQLAVGDRKNIGLLKKKFLIDHNKTYNPPNFLMYKFSKDLLMSLFIGLVDGDGSIFFKSRGKTLRIQCHSSWFHFMENLKEFLSKNGIPSTNKINNRGYTQFTICSHEGQQTLLKRIKELNLPVLNRKWDRLYQVNGKNDKSITQFPNPQEIV